MKQAFINKKLNAANRALAEVAASICIEYAARGYDLTLRQLYYQFVARDLLPNKVEHYKRLGSVVNDARLMGLIDWNHLVDRTRSAEVYRFWDDPVDILKSSARALKHDVHEVQAEHIEVWVEKEALIDVVSRACSAYRINHFACRGYVSQSEMYTASKRLLNHVKPVTILHLGDHDPSGIDMTRDIQDRLTMFCGAFSHTPDVRRIGLNMDQIRQYSCPPNPAKATDARWAQYAAKHGNQSWELDALDPDVLVNLIRDNIEGLLDVKLYEEQLAEEKDVQKAMVRAVDSIVLEDFL